MRAGFPLLFSAVIAAGVTGLAAATDGFRVVTSEGARRLQVAYAPRVVPPVSLTDQDGAAFSLADYRGRTLLVEFIYTRCPTICGVLGEAFQHIQDRLRRDRATERISLLSISFDTAHDRTADLKAYGERFGASAPLWRIAVPSAGERQKLLDSFGVVVIPDGLGGFIHNGAIFILAPDGRLVRILDAVPAPRLIAGLAAAVHR